MPRKKEGDIFPLLLIGVGAYFLFTKQAQAGVTIAPPKSPTGLQYPPIGKGGLVGNPKSLSNTSYVKWIQATLNKTRGAGLVVDGVYGPLTTAAVKDFQWGWGIVQDGIVGPETDYYLHAALGDPAYIEQPYAG